MIFFLFVLVANVAIGYMIAILLGIGPPDFRTAWARIKLSLVSRLKKHAPPTHSEPELPTETPSVTPVAVPVSEPAATPPVTPVAESTATPQISPATLTPATPPAESTGGNPNAEQPE